jgi:DNA repair exonuclease SbcCD ATPase subunit
MANEAFRPMTAQELIKMYNLDALIADREKTKVTSEKIKVLEQTSNTLKDFAETIDKQIKDLEDQVDGKISTWFFSGIPSATTEPEVNWTTEEEKATHVGDIYYDRDTGAAYTYMYVDGSYVWQKSESGDASEALARANAAQATADSKMQIFVDTPYPPYQIGDLWLKDDKVIYRCRAEKESGSYDENDWKLATDFTNDDYAKNVEEQLNSYKETVSTDYVLNTTFEATNEGFAQEVKSTTTKINEMEFSIDATNQELNETLNKVVTKTEIEEVKKSVTQLQTDSFTKTEIKKIVSGTYFDENGEPVTVSALKSTSAKFDEDGMHYAQSGAKTGSTINHLGLKVNEVTQVNGVSVEGNDLLFAGYVDETKVDSTKPNYNAKLKDFEGQSVVYTRNVITDNYFVIGSHSRLEDYEDGTGIFYIGG